MNERQEQIEKIRGVLAMTQSPYEAEAKTALLLAQKLLSKYHLTMSEVSDGPDALTKEEPIVKTLVPEISCSRPWVRKLALTVAKNFRCCVYISSFSGKHRITMVGYQTDVEVAVEVYRAAFKFAERASNNRAQLANDKGFSSTGIKVSYCEGFVQGLAEAYAEQVTKDTSLALMVVVPEKALAILDGMGDFEGGVIQRASLDEHFVEGLRTGYSYGSKKAITHEEV